MKNLKYPVFQEKISKKLSNHDKKNNETVFWFNGGDLSKRKNVLNNDDIVESLKIIYPYLLKLNKSKNKKNFKCFRWCIHYSIPNTNKIAAHKIIKDYRSISDQNSHTLEPICTDWDDKSKLIVSSDLFQSKQEDPKNPYGPLIEVLILIANSQKSLKELNFRDGRLHYGWLSHVSDQNFYLHKKFKHWGWLGFPLNIKKQKKFSPVKLVSSVINNIPKSWIKDVNLIIKKRIRFLKSKIYGEDLEALIYLRNEINPKIKFTFAKLDKTEKKILKKLSII
tara:strand:+ start:518 stop:1357 length:840 start_codon:yes stop_codon:yes gene_type:complete